jgi:bifunctional non-homologous end joining protein LigD
MVTVSNVDRVVFPEVGKTKGDVVAYYERIAPRALPHLIERPLSIRRYPKGLAGPGFFQKNVPAHYPDSIGRVAVPRSREASKKHRDGRNAEQDVTIYPLVRDAEQLAYLANQGAIELHVPTSRAPDLNRPDRLVIDLDPPAHAFEQARRAAQLVRDALAAYELSAVPVATGSKGYHIVAPIERNVAAETLALSAQKFATLLAAEHASELTTTYRIALRAGRVFVDWLRNNRISSVVAAYSLRATAGASVATPIGWDEIATTDPDAFHIDDWQRLLDRPDPLAELAVTASDPLPFVRAVEAAFERSGLVLEVFDRFRS